MPEPIASTRPRVALVSGDAESAGHLRDAVAGHVDIVYAATAAEFDDARLRDSGATAALVNLDGGDWLDAISARLAGAGVAVVFNDPEISGRLAGWEQARWLRHLTAKLVGSTEYDPPRPRAAPAGRPAAADASTATAAAPHQESDMQPLAAAGEAGAHDALPTSPTSPDPQPADAAPLDLDTAALSAMIDARLAEPDRGAEPESTEVWCVAGDGVAATAAPQRDAAAPMAAPVEEKDVLKGLPSVDDWQLLDPEAPVTAPTPAPQQAQPQPQPLAAGAFADLELVPLDTAAPVVLNTEPIERWMRVDSRDRPAVRRKPAAPDGDAA